MRYLLLALALSALAAEPAQAFCEYRGKLYAKTTVAREFRDSKWVVKAKLEAADYHWANSGESWTVYTVRVLTRYKGSPARFMRVFTYRDSGGFYLDKGTSPDLDTDYLLFLVPPTQELPRGINRVAQVNYSCGQSRPWSEVPLADRQALERRSIR